MVAASLQEKFYEYDASNIDIEKAALIGVSSPQPMKYSDVHNAVKTTHAVAKDDPVFDYMLESQPSRSDKFRISFTQSVSISVGIYGNKAWSVEDGKGFVMFQEYYKSPGRIEKMLQKTARILSVLVQSLRSREQKKRGAEFVQKMKNSIETTLGKDRVKEMVELSTIGVYPELQGKGYGTQLAKVVSAVADAQGRECFLLSSNVKVNTVFYNNLGYETVDIFLLGEDNPKWDKEPVPVALMVRPSFQGRNKY